MSALRSIIGSGLYNVVFIGWTAISVTLMVVCLPFPRPMIRLAVKLWAWSQHWALKFLVGLDFEVRGRENIVPGAAIYASKHQSAWDTYIFFLLFNDPSYVMKKELMQLPVWGWVARKYAAVSVDREGGPSALKALVRDVKQRLADGRPVIIFPEGTRTRPGDSLPYHPGIAALYNHCAGPVVPVVPVALNSGLFWGRRNYRKQAGRIIIEFLPAIPAGMKRRKFIKTLEATIEGASRRLATEGVARYPMTRDALFVDAQKPEDETADAEKLVD